MLSIREIAKATTLRFLPTVTIGILALTALLNGSPLGMPRQFWLFLGTILLEQALGFSLTLLAYRRRLGSDAAVSGRRTVLVGMFATGLLAAAAIGGAAVIPSSAAWTVWTLTGTISAAVMYWPWLRRRPTERELAAWEAALAPSDALLLDAAGVPEMVVPVRALDERSI